MTTHVLDRRTKSRGVLIRLDHGNPVVRWFGNTAEFRPEWSRVEITSSDDYLLPRGRFEAELWVDGNDDVWRRRVLENAWPCEPGMTHLVGARAADNAPLCWHCGADSREWASVEIFVLVAAQGFPADHPARPQSRADVEAFAGALLRVGSEEARLRTAEVQDPTADGPGCPLAVGLVMLALCCLVLVGVQLARLVH